MRSHKYFFYLDTYLNFTFREYDRENVALFPDSANVGLKVISVPGLAEKRPSVLRGMAHPFSIFGKILTRSLSSHRGLHICESEYLTQGIQGICSFRQFGRYSSQFP